MLYTDTVEPATLDLLKGLMTIPVLENFYLVGRTSLALRYGHRTSEDIDLFSTTNFDNIEIITEIQKFYPEFQLRNTINPIDVFGYIQNVKTDIVKHHYFKQIGNTILEDGIRMFDDKDTIAMKIFAILKRAAKKDFWDLAELLKHNSIEDSIDYNTQKYPNTQLLISIPYAITYFADAEESEDPISLIGQTWEGIKSFIQGKVRDYLA